MTPTTSPKPRVYVDTSAYVEVLLAQRGWEAIRMQLDRSEALSSVLLVLETRRNLTRLAREGVLSSDGYRTCIDQLNRDMEHFELRDLTFELCDAVVMPAVATPRSLDLAHLQTALWFHAEARLAKFLTTDVALANAARELGLPV